MCKMPVKGFAMQRCVMLSITLCMNYRLIVQFADENECDFCTDDLTLLMIFSWKYYVSYSEPLRLKSPLLRSNLYP